MSVARKDWKSIFDYNLYGDPSLSLLGRDPDLRADVVFLLDGSGSMVSPEPGKWQAAVDATVLFRDVMLALRHPTFTDRYRSVVFRWLWPGNTDGTTTVPAGTGMQDITVPLDVSTFNPAFTPVSSYSTPIGLGLQKAIEQFEFGTEQSLYTDKMIILLSDGKHNEGIDPLDVVLAPDWPASVKVFSIGLGEDDIEPETIERISGSTYGDYRISPSPREIEGFFCEILCNTSWKLQNIPVDGTIALIDGSKVAFIVIWDDPATPVTFNLQPPGGGGAITPTLNPYAASGLTVNHHAAGTGENHAFYVLDSIPASMYGLWEFASVSGADVLLKVIQDPRVIAEFGFDAIEQHTGEPVVCTARITESGKPLTGLTNVYAKLIRSPAMAMGTLLSENSPDSDYPASPQARADITPYRHYMLGVMKNAGITSLSKADPWKVMLRDDGLNGDIRANDGIYSGYFDGASHEGSYSFQFRAEGTPSSGAAFKRGVELSVYVKFKAQPDATKVSIVSQKLEPDSGRIVSMVQVIPKDVTGAYLGPFKADLIEVSAKTGSFHGPAVDNRDGSYTFTHYGAEDELPVVTVIIGDVIVADRDRLDAPPVADDDDAGDNPFSGSLHTGVTMPLGDMGDLYDPGFSLAVDLDYLLTPELSLVGILSYKYFHSGNALLDDTYWVTGSINLKLRQATAPASLYVKAGPGFYIPENDSTRLGFNIGAGIDYQFDPDITGELGIDYHFIDGEYGSLNFIDISLGIIFKF